MHPFVPPRASRLRVLCCALLTISLICLTALAGCSRKADARQLAAFHQAAAAGDVGQLHAYRPLPGEIDIPDAEGNTPLEKAFFSDHAEAFALLLDWGASLDHLHRKGFAAIHRAPMHHRPRCLEVMLERGHRVDAPDWAGNSPLYWAGRSGDVECAKVLLRFGADVNYLNPESAAAPIDGAISENNIEVVELLLSEGARIDRPSQHGFTPLHKAALDGHVELVELLLDHGGDPLLPDSFGRTPLDRANQNKHSDVIQLIEAHEARSEKAADRPPTTLHIAVVKSDLAGVNALLENGAPVDQIDERGRTPLFSAATPAMARLLIEHGSDPTAPDRLGRTPLHEAADHDRDGVVPVLLEAGADPNAVDRRNDTPLHETTTTVITRLLLEAGADPMARGAEDNTPLHVAGWRGSPGMVQALLDAGAEVDAVDIRGLTPLHAAVYINSASRHEPMKILLSAGADPLKADKEGITPLARSISSGYIPKTKILVEAGAPADIFVAAAVGNVERVKAELERDPELVSARNHEQQTALGQAAYGNHVDVARLLLDAGAPVDIRSQNDRTPLDTAAMRGHVDMMKLLIENGADVDARTSYGGTPLMAAAFFGKTKAVALLIENSAKLDVERDRGWTALHMAVRYDQGPVVLLLLNAGADGNHSDKSGETPRMHAKRLNKKNALAAFEKFEADQSK